MKCIMCTPTPNIQESIGFYKKLNLSHVLLDEKNYMTSSAFILEIDNSNFARPGIKIYKENLRDTIEDFIKLTTVTRTDEGFILADPSGCIIYLFEEPFNDSFRPNPDKTSLLGNFAGVSLETTDLEKSILIWEALAFKVKSGSKEQGWLSLQNHEGFGISLMKINSCPHLFYNPSMTFFNGKENLKIIDSIKNAGIEINEGITVFNNQNLVDNVVIRDPGGFGFFIFSD